MCKVGSPRYEQVSHSIGSRHCGRRCTSIVAMHASCQKLVCIVSYRRNLLRCCLLDGARINARARQQSKKPRVLMDNTALRRVSEACMKMSPRRP